MKNANYDFQPKGFTPFKGRTLAYGQQVKVYRNLHKHCYSVADAKTGVVLGYVDSIKLQNAEFKVSEAGRQRVLQEKRKNVHATITGTFIAIGAGKHDARNEAYYNPYRTETFVHRTASGDIGEPLHKAALVALTTEGVYYTGAYV